MCVGGVVWDGGEEGAMGRPTCVVLDTKLHRFWQFTSYLRFPTNSIIFNMEFCKI